MEQASDSAPKPSLSVLLVDDHAMLLDGLRSLIDGEPDLEVVGTATCRDEAKQQAIALEPDVAVVDLLLPGSGLKAIEQIHQHRPQTRILALTVLDDPEHLSAALRRGAHGYLVKRAAAKELLDAVRTLAKGEEYFGVGMASQNLDREQPPLVPLTGAELSSRETQVLRLLARGYTHKEIGVRLNVSKKTVDTYRARLQDKLGVKSRAELVKYAIHAGLLAEPDNV